MFSLGLSLWPSGSYGPSISFPASTVQDNATVGTTVNTATIVGTTTGTPVWSLTNNAGGQFAINSSTGVVTVAGALTDGVQVIVIAVSGTTPVLAPLSVGINVTSANALLADTGSPILADTGSPILTQ
jgi:hypothetical protein